MTTRILRRHRERGHDLLCRLDGVGLGLAIFEVPERALIDHDAGIDECRVIRHQPARTIAAAAFLVGRKCHNDVTIWDVALLLEPDDIRDERGGLRLVVRDTATVEVPLTLSELERIEVRRPVALQRLDHVEVRKEEERLGTVRAALAVIPQHHVVLVGPHAAHENVALWKPGLAESLGHRLREDRRPHGRGRRVGLDHFLVDLTREPLIGAGRGRLGAQGHSRRHKADRDG